MAKAHSFEDISLTGALLTGRLKDKVSRREEAKVAHGAEAPAVSEAERRLQQALGEASLADRQGDLVRANGLCQKFEHLAHEAFNLDYEAHAVSSQADICFRNADRLGALKLYRKELSLRRAAAGRSRSSTA